MKNKLETSNEKSDEILKIDIFLLTIFLIILMHGISPFIGRVISTYLSTYFLLAIVGIVWIGAFRWKWMQWMSSVMPLFILATIQTLYNIITQGGMVNKIYGELLFFCPIIIAVAYKDLIVSQQKIILKFTVFAIVITFFTSLWGYIQNPFAARYLATVSSADDIKNVFYEWMNIGGFKFVYMVLIIYPIIIAYMKNTKKNIIICFAVFYLLFLFFIKAEYATAFLLFNSLSILWFMKKGTSFNNLFVGMIFLTVLFLILQISIGQFFSYIATQVDSYTLQTRIEYVADILLGIQNESDVGLRKRVLMSSINTIIENPILGCWYKENTTGGHSFILDTTAIFGISGLALITFCYMQIYRNFFYPFKNSFYYPYAMSSFCVAIFLSTINTSNHWFEIVFIVPLVFYLKERKKKNEDILDS